MSVKPNDPTETVAGVLLIAVSAFFGWQTLDLEIGTSLRMGPGYFPMVLSILMFLMGLLIVAQSFRARNAEPLGTIAWRGILLILPAPIFFGLTVRGLGFVPALFLASLIAAQASVRMRPLPSLLLAVLVTLLSTLIFSYALGLPFRRFGPWLPI